MKRFLVLALATILSTTSFANLIYTSKTNKGQEVIFKFPSNRVDVDTALVTICSSGNPIRKLVLWMPDHGHGTTPPSYGQTENSCTLVYDLDFSMPGKWELKATLANGETSTLTLEVGG